MLIQVSIIKLVDLTVMERWAYITLDFTMSLL